MNIQCRESDHRGFSLTELLILFSIIAVIAIVAFTIVNPNEQLQDSRDAARAQDMRAIRDALHAYEEHTGAALETFAQLESGKSYLIVGGGKTRGCNDLYELGFCNAVVSEETSCFDISELIKQDYLGWVPVSPGGRIAWDQGEFDSANGTGYTLRKESDSQYIITSCESGRQVFSIGY